MVGAPAEGPVPPDDPLEGKLELPRGIVARSPGDGGGREGGGALTRVVREGGAPDEVPEHTLPDGNPVHLPAVIAAAFGLSTSEARRMIAQGGVKTGRRAALGARPAARGPRRQAAPGGEASLSRGSRSRS